MKQEFIDDLFDFVQKSGIAGVLILSGVDLSNRSDEQMLYVFPDLFGPMLISTFLPLAHRRINYSRTPYICPPHCTDLTNSLYQNTPLLYLKSPAPTTMNHRFHSFPEVV